MASFFTPRPGIFLAVCPLDGQPGHGAGRQLLAELYRKHTGQALPPIALGPRGKPFFPGSSWHFSISHTKAHVFCALARENIGIDAEELTREVNPRLPEKVLSPAEHAQYLAAPDPRQAFLTLWVLKEAQAKLTGEGLRGFPSHTAFHLDDPRVTEAAGCLLAVLTQSDYDTKGEKDHAF